MSSSWPALHAQLLRRIARHDFHRQFLILRNRQPPLVQFLEAGNLLQQLQTRDPDHDGKEAILRSLVREAQEGGPEAEAAVTILVLALWPGLDAIHRRLLRHYCREPEALAADLAGGMVTAIAKADLGRVTRLAATLLRNLERDLRRALAQTRRLRVEELADDVAAPDDAVLLGRLLERDLHRVLGEDAVVVTAVALNGERQADVAFRHGFTHDALRKRYQRALARLRAHLEEYS